MDPSLLAELPPDVARDLQAGPPASGAGIAARLAELHADGRIRTDVLCRAIGRLPVDLPDGAGKAEVVLLAHVGSGAMGDVHLARDERLARHVAVKRIAGAATEGRRERFQQEARIVAQLDHPSIPPVYGVEVGADGGIVGYSMKLVHGRTLKEYLLEVRGFHERHERPDEDHALPARLGVFLKACDAVHYAHSRGVLHRDLKPSNVMVGAFGEVLVMDWGIARRVGQASERSAPPIASMADAETVVAEVTGTPSYMSPEQANGGEGSLDARSDQYALGLLLQEIVTLDKAVEGGTVLALYRASRGERGPMRHAFGDHVPRELHAIVDKATRLDRNARYASVDAMADDVRRVLADEPIRAAPDGPVQRASRVVGRNRGAALASILVLALVLVLVLVLAAAGAAAAAGITRWRAAQRHQALAATVREVSAHARRVDARFQDYAGLLTGLALSADHALRSPAPEGVSVVRPESLRATGTLAFSKGYESPISVAHPIAYFAPGADPAALDATARKVVGLHPELERVVFASDPEPPATRAERVARLVDEGAPVVWAYVALAPGLMVVWPGAEDYPADYVPADQDWYRSGFGQRRTVWDPASRDPSDTEDVGLLVTAMVGLFDGDVPIGVAALDVSIDHVLDDLLAPPVDAPVDTWLVDPEGRTMATSIERQGEPPPFPYDEVLAAVAAGESAGVRTIDAPDGARMVTWAHLDALRWTYAVVGREDDLLGGW